MEANVLAAILHIEVRKPSTGFKRSMCCIRPDCARSVRCGAGQRVRAGVPVRLPSSTRHGPALTDLGKDLIRACNRLNILDRPFAFNERVSGMSPELSDAPLVATHSNAMC